MGEVSEFCSCEHFYCNAAFLVLSGIRKARIVTIVNLFCESVNVLFIASLKGGLFLYMPESTS